MANGKNMKKHPSRISHKTHDGCNSYMIKEFSLVYAL